MTDKICVLDLFEKHHEHLCVDWFVGVDWVPATAETCCYALPVWEYGHADGGVRARAAFELWKALNP